MNRLRQQIPTVGARHRTVGLLALACAVAGCSPATDSPAENAARAAFAGSAACRSCHPVQHRQWLDSHHARAMQAATADNVLGDFADTEFENFGKTTRFFTDGDQYLVETADARGQRQQFTVSHTFGVEPLQQYLIDFPNGRKQALSVAWDSRPASDGGQRWFHLYPDEEVPPGDLLHWTGPYFNWNTMCAECHSTGVQMNYAPEKDAFETRFAEISVGCEACHGPGTIHLAQAADRNFDESGGFPADLDDRAGVVWETNPGTGMPARSGQPARTLQQPEACGRCHSRRAVLAGEYTYGRPLLDTHMVSLLEEPLYFPDGRVQDEVYEYGSFLQSRMYAAGVTCTDCHDPHSAQLRTGSDTDDVCGQCHLPAKFSTGAHPAKQAEGAPGSCVACHMPARTFMGVDERHDHSFRVPGAGSEHGHYGGVIAAGRAGAANGLLADGVMNAAFPAIARASVLALLRPPPDRDVLAALRAGLDAADPLLRIAALRALRRQQADLRADGSRLLRDPVRAVRIEAAQTYAGMKDRLSADDARAFSLAATEYREAMLAAGAIPESLVNLALFEETLGNAGDSDRYLKRAAALAPGHPEVRHSYGLRLVRTGNTQAALEEFAAAADLAPDNDRYAYVHGIAQHSLGQTGAALLTLRRARQRFPDSFDIGWALATILRDHGQRAAALTIANELALEFPGDENVARLRKELGGRQAPHR